MKEVFTEAFEKFMEEDFWAAADSATKASWDGSGYSLELFPDGTYRVIWDNHLSDVYESPGLIISIPPLSDEDWDEDPSLCFYENAERKIRDKFQAD
jgi:hypothetical protein